MITCPACQNQEKEGALFCTQCGSALVGHEQPPEVLVGVLLSLLDSGQIITMTGRQEFIIGRASEELSNPPDIDLSPYLGYEKGVSRLHASITVNGSTVTVTDLESANGTLLNGLRINPKQAYHLHHGDLLTLGKLMVQVLLRL